MADIMLSDLQRDILCFIRKTPATFKEIEAIFKLKKNTANWILDGDIDKLFEPILTSDETKYKTTELGNAHLDAIDREEMRWEKPYKLSRIAIIATLITSIIAIVISFIALLQN